MKASHTDRHNLSEYRYTSTCVYANGDQLAILRVNNYESLGYEVLSIRAPFNGQLNTYNHSRPDGQYIVHDRSRPDEIGLEIKANCFEVHICHDREAAMRVINKLLGTSYC